MFSPVLFKSLQAFRKKSKGVKVDLAEFMKHLADQYNCDSPYELGIRIQGLGLPISVRLLHPFKYIFPSVYQC